MKALDIILGLGAVGAAVVAAKLIADAAKPKTAALPPADPSNQNTGPFSNTQSSAQPRTPIDTGGAGTSEPAAMTFNPATDCAGGMSTTRACWCWGGGFGLPECADFDYTVFVDGQSVQ